MFCNASAFVLGTGCPNIQVDLSFPTLDYCESSVSLHFAKPNQQYLNVPQNFPTPDVAGDAALKCIDIEPVANINIRSLYDKLNLTHFLGQAIDNNLDNTPNTFTVKHKVLSGGSYAEGDCADGEYQLGLNFDVPCILDSWPEHVPVKNQDGVVIGSMKFSHLTGCRITGEMNLEMACSGTAVVEHCMLDNVYANSEKLSGTVKGNIHFGLTDCGVKYTVKWPSPSSVQRGLYIDLKAREPNDPRQVNTYIAVPAIADQDMDMLHLKVNGNFSVPYYVDVDIGAWAALSVYQVPDTNPHDDKYRHKFVIFSKPISLDGYTGPNGSKGSRGDTVTIYIGRDGPTGSRGPTGFVGLPGQCLTCHGSRGPRGGDVTCYQTPVYSNPAQCTFVDTSGVIHRVKSIALNFGSYARLHVESENVHLLYVDTGGKYRLSRYLSSFVKEFTIPSTVYQA